MALVYFFDTLTNRYSRYSKFFERNSFISRCDLITFFFLPDLMMVDWWSFSFPYQIWCLPQSCGVSTESLPRIIFLALHHTIAHVNTFSPTSSLIPILPPYSQSLPSFFLLSLYSYKRSLTLLYSPPPPYHYYSLFSLFLFQNRSRESSSKVRPHPVILLLISVRHGRVSLSF